MSSPWMNYWSSQIRYRAESPVTTFIFATGLFFMINGCAGNGCSGCNGCWHGQQQGSADCPVGQKGGSVFLLDIVPQGGNGPLLYSGQYGGGLPNSCINRVDSISNESSYPIRIVEKDGDSSKCLSSSVRLAVKQSSSAADMMKVFGDLHPKLPIQALACVEAGGDPPRQLAIGVQYTTAAN
jgi:hypothetical protein